MWRNRIIGSGEAQPSSLAANPYAYRIHPPYQHEAVLAAISELGWLSPVVLNDRTGRLIDGHLRTIVALGHAQSEKIPVVYVDLSADEERQALNLIDPISALARIDHMNISLNGSIERCTCPSCGSHHFKAKEETHDQDE